MNMILALGCQCFNCGIEFPADEKAAGADGWKSGFASTEDDEDGELSTVFACKRCSPLLLDAAPFPSESA